jgi:hypothetical protein
MSGRAYWLTEPGIGVERRVARWQTEQLYSAYELRRLDDDAASASDIAKRITETALELGFPLVSGKSHKHTHVV